MLWWEAATVLKSLQLKQGMRQKQQQGEVERESETPDIVWVQMRLVPTSSESQASCSLACQHQWHDSNWGALKSSRGLRENSAAVLKMPMQHWSVEREVRVMRKELWNKRMQINFFVPLGQSVMMQYFIWALSSFLKRNLLYVPVSLQAERVVVIIPDSEHFSAAPAWVKPKLSAWAEVLTLKNPQNLQLDLAYQNCK